MLWIPRPTPERQKELDEVLAAIRKMAAESGIKITSKPVRTPRRKPLRDVDGLITVNK